MNIWLSERKSSTKINSRQNILILEDGAIDYDEVKRLLSKRNNRPVNIKE